MKREKLRAKRARERVPEPAENELLKGCLVHQFL